MKSTVMFGLSVRMIWCWYLTARIKPIALCCHLLIIHMQFSSISFKCGAKKGALVFSEEDQSGCLLKPFFWFLDHLILGAVSCVKSGMLERKEVSFFALHHDS